MSRFGCCLRVCAVVSISNDMTGASFYFFYFWIGVGGGLQRCSSKGNLLLESIKSQLYQVFVLVIKSESLLLFAFFFFFFGFFSCLKRDCKRSIVLEGTLFAVCVLSSATAIDPSEVNHPLQTALQLLWFGVKHPSSGLSITILFFLIG